MSGPVVLPVGYMTNWEISAEPNGLNEVWFYLRCGPLSGGTFMSREQAVTLANMLLSAAQIAGDSIPEKDQS